MKLKASLQFFSKFNCKTNLDSLRCDFDFGTKFRIKKKNIKNHKYLKEYSTYNWFKFKIKKEETRIKVSILSLSDKEWTTPKKQS